MSEPNLFPVTEWTFVIQVIQRGDQEEAAAAIGRFYERYRGAICRFFQMRKLDAETAEDLTHEFIHRQVVAKAGGFILRADRDRAKFRTFLSSCLSDFLKDQARRAAAGIRSTGAPDLPLEIVQKFSPNSLPSLPSEADEGFDAAFAEEVLALACPRETDNELLNAIVGETKRTELAGDWEMSEGAVKTAISRFRDRFKIAVRDEVRRTLGPDATDADVDEEIRLLMKALLRRAVTFQPGSADNQGSGAQCSPSGPENDEPQRSDARATPGPSAGPGSQGEAT